MLSQKNRINERLLGILYFVTALAIVIGFGELIIRLAPGYFGNILTYNQIKDNYLVIVDGKEYKSWPFWKPDDKYAFSLKKNLNLKLTPKTRDSAFTVKTNSLGFRFDKKLLSEERKKVMVIGDSVTFGHGADDNNTIADYLSLKSKDMLYLNFGVGAWSFGEYYLTYGMFDKYVSPEFVVLVTYAGNDFHELDYTLWYGREDGLLPSAPLQRLDYEFDSNGEMVGRSLAYRYPLLRNSALWVSLDTHLFSLVRDFTIKSKAKRYKHNSVDIALEVVRDIGKKINILVVVIPFYGDVGNVGFAGKISENSSVSVLDAASIVRDMASPDNIGKYYLSDGVHFTTEGNKKMANEISKYIAKKGWDKFAFE